MTTGQWISEATTATFEQEVLERSRRMPVLIDFWAPWCGPCQVLGPALEEAVEARGGAVWLVKVNIDDNPDIASAFQVKGVPTVKAVLDGAVVNEIVGALDRRGVEEFIDSAFPSAEDQALSQAEALLTSGEADQVAPTLAAALDSPGHRDRANLLLARADVARGKPAEAEAALARLPAGSPELQEAEPLRLRLDMLRAAEGADEQELRRRLEGTDEPAAAEARWALAGKLLSQGKHEDALELLLELLIKDRRFRDDGARKAMLAIFEELGIHHDVSRKYRRQMQIYL